MVAVTGSTVTMAPAPPTGLLTQPEPLPHRGNDRVRRRDIHGTTDPLGTRLRGHRARRVDHPPLSTCDIGASNHPVRRSEGVAASILRAEGACHARSRGSPTIDLSRFPRD